MPREPFTFWLPLGDGIAARMTAEIVEEPFGGLDPETRREPTVTEMEQIGSEITLRHWQFHKPI